MTLHQTSTRLRSNLHSNRLTQIALIAVFWLVGEGIARLSGLPVPGGVIGMALVLLLLVTGKISLRSMRGGAQWLLADMLLFFVPAVLAVLDHSEFLGLVGLKILAVILGGTIAVMCTTALAVDFGYRMMMRRELRDVSYG
jgi:holin-like protein